MLCVVMLAANCKKDETTTTPPADARDIFIGNFHMLDSVDVNNPWNPGYVAYSRDIVISKNPTDASKINIMNLYNEGYTVTASVSGSIFIIPNQQMGNMQGTSINGTGKFENNKLSYDYTYGNPGGNSHVKGIGTKFTK